MLHSKTRTNRIWTQEPVYRDSRAGNLDETRVGVVLSSPLQHRFHSDGEGCLPVAVHHHTTLSAPVQGVVLRLVSLIHRTAVWTPFGGVVSINFLDGDGHLLTVGFEEAPELSMGDAIDLAVCLSVELTFSSPDVEFFDGDGGVVGLGEIHDFLGNLAASGSDEVRLLALEPFQVLSRLSRPLVSVALEPRFSLKISALPDSDIPPEVELFDYFGCSSVKDGDGGEGGRTNINPNNESPIIVWGWELSFEHGGDFSALKERNVLEIPSVIEEGAEPLGLPVEPDWNHEAFSWRIGNFEAWVASFGLHELEPAGVEPDGAPPELTFNGFALSPDIFSCFLDNVGWQEGGLSYV